MIDVVCAIFENNDKVLICRRKESIKNGGKWEFPGGKVINGESMLKALRREIKEELNVNILVKEWIAIIKYVEDKYTLLAYECELLDPIIDLNDHDQIKWVLKKDLLQYDLLVGDRVLVEHLISNGFLTNDHPCYDDYGRIKS